MGQLPKNPVPISDKDRELFDKLEEVYGDHGMSNIDLYIGGMLESNNGPGPLFRRIIKDQFERIRDADRFWFENKDNDIFKQPEIEKIRNITLWDVIINSTNIEEGEIQKKDQETEQERVNKEEDDKRDDIKVTNPETGVAVPSIGGTSTRAPSSRMDEENKPLENEA